MLPALDRPALAVDLPGHGHSDGGRAGSLDVDANADDVATAIERLEAGHSVQGDTPVELARLIADFVP